MMEGKIQGMKDTAICCLFLIQEHFLQHPFLLSRIYVNFENGSSQGGRC